MMRMILSRVAPNVVVGALVLAACGARGDGAGSRDSDPIVATTSIWSDITSGIGCGTAVASLMPTGADPHSYEPSLRDRELLTRAEVVIANGAGLEATAEQLIDAAIADGVTVVEAATYVDLLVDEHDDHDDGAALDPHGHGAGGDPHFWQDPRRVAGTVDVIASALEAAGITTCADEYRDELFALDAEITEILSTVPTDHRVLVTSHDSLAYFAERYDFEVVGTVIPSTSTLADTSAGELADLSDLIEARGVGVIFTDALASSSDADALADRLGVEIVPLATGSLTEGSPTYPDMLRNNAHAIADALAP